MFPLSTQVRFACIQAYEAVAYLQGSAFSPARETLLEEGRNAGEAPGTLADAAQRIKETISFLQSVDPAALDGDPARPIALKLPGGRAFDLTADQFVRDWALPQFYFHVMAAYLILRNAGVDLGKADYVQHMFKYFRQSPAS